jgi:hypothetical protein
LAEATASQFCIFPPVFGSGNKKKGLLTDPVSGPLSAAKEQLYCLERIAFNLIQIEGNPRPAQAGNIAVALNRVNLIERNTL